MDSETDCMQGLNEVYEFAEGAFFLPAKGCTPNLHTRPHKTIREVNCAKTTELDYLDFFYFDLIGDDWILYCPHQKVQFEKETVDCPELPFKVPVGKNFTVGEHSFDMSMVTGFAKKDTDPYYNEQINRRVDPLSRLSEIRKIRFGENLNPGRWLNFDGQTSTMETIIIVMVLNMLCVIIYKVASRFVMKM